METFLTLLQYISLTSPSPYTFWVVHKAAIAEIQIMNVSFKQQHVSITVKRLNCSWIIPAHIFSHFHKKYSDNDFCFFNHPKKVLVLLKTADCTSSFTWVWGVKGDFYAHLPLYDSDINRSVIFSGLFNQSVILRYDLSFGKSCACQYPGAKYLGLLYKK